MSTIRVYDSHDTGDFGFQIAPMIDVVFVLLLFFMAVAGQSQRESWLSIPPPTPGEGAFALPILVDLDSSGRVSVGGKFISDSSTDPELAPLTNELREALRIRPGLVVIRPAMDTAHQHVIRVLEACQKARPPGIAFR